MSYSIVGFETFEEQVAVAVETYYDRQTRSWVSFLVDADGNPIGDSLYDGTKADRDASIRMLQSQIDK